ncbi:MAG: GGDEF domain-containing protein [Deltaproteobacteria bacterium]
MKGLLFLLAFFATGAGLGIGLSFMLRNAFIKENKENEELKEKIKKMEEEAAKNQERIKKLEEENAKLKNFSITDDLTGLLNRHGIRKIVERHWKRFCVSEEPIAVLMIDIDFFKKINDTYGHPVGDEYLQLMAEFLKNNVRPTDYVGRYGGEEFIETLTMVSLDEAKEIAERIRMGIGKIKMPYESISASIGLVWGVPGRDFLTPEEMVKAADFALYQAKDNGRNRVEIWENE